MDEGSKFNKRMFLARYGTKIPDHSKAKTYDDFMELGASMENPIAPDEHIMKGTQINFYNVHEPAFRAYKNRFGERHPDDDGNE